MIQEHVEPVLARLQAHQALVDIVVDGLLDQDRDLPKPPPLVVFHAWTPTREVTRLGGVRPDTAEFRFTVHCIGEDAAQARRLADAVEDQLGDGWKPAVPGWNPGHLRHPTSLAPRPGLVTKPATHITTDEYRMTSRRASF